MQFKYEQSVLVNRSQIQINTLLYTRIAITLYCLFLIIWSFIIFWEDGEWWYYYTNQSFLVLVIYYLYVTSLMLYKKYKNWNIFESEILSSREKKLLKIAQYLFVLAFTNALMLDIVYWSLLSYLDDWSVPSNSFVTANLHSINFVFILSDLILSKKSYTKNNL